MDLSKHLCVIFASLKGWNRLISWMLIRIQEYWFENVGAGMVANGYGHSGHRTLKLAVEQERINGINWLFA